MRAFWVALSSNSKIIENGPYFRWLIGTAEGLDVDEDRRRADRADDEPATKGSDNITLSGSPTTTLKTTMWTKNHSTEYDGVIHSYASAATTKATRDRDLRVT